MTPSACQRKTVSCCGCCGLFNLDLPDYAARKGLLRERTREFSANTDFGDPDSMRKFRREQEAREEGFSRHNEETYVCPFLGYLEGGESRTGCMIHPVYSGDESSQNYSFYGASICQAYDCTSKDKDLDQRYASFLEQHFPDEDHYSRLMADVLFYSALERLPCFPHFFEAEDKLDALLTLFRARLLTKASRAVTSFEIKFRYFEDVGEELREYTREADVDRAKLSSAIQNLL